MTFKQFIAEIFDLKTIDAVQPAGYWVNFSRENSHFVFDLESDPVKNCEGKGCYFVYMFDGDIAFGHVDTNYDDRHNQNQESGANPQEMLNTVMWAVKKYVETFKPEHVSWKPANKTRVGATNLNARQKIYDKVASRFLSKDYTRTATGSGAFRTIWSRNDTPEALAAQAAAKKAANTAANASLAAQRQDQIRSVLAARDASRPSPEDILFGTTSPTPTQRPNRWK